MGRLGGGSGQLCQSFSLGDARVSPGAVCRRSAGEDGDGPWVGDIHDWRTCTPQSWGLYYALAIQILHATITVQFDGEQAGHYLLLEVWQIIQL